MANKKVHRLTDVEVEKVGLVSMGANQERFFLLKSEQEDNMPDPNVAPVEDAEDKDSWLDEFVEKVKARLGKQDEAVADADIEPEIEAEPEAEPEVEAEPEIEPEAKEVAEVEAEAEVEEPVADEEPIAEVEKQEDRPEPDELTALSKAHNELLERLEKAEKALQEQLDKAARQEIIEKAESLRCVPVEKSALVENLHRLQKADQDVYEFFFGLLSSMDKALADGGLFIEKGTTEVEEKDADALVQAAISSGDKDALAKALFSMSKEQAYEMIEARRKKSGRR